MARADAELAKDAAEVHLNGLGVTNWPAMDRLAIPLAASSATRRSLIVKDPTPAGRWSRVRVGARSEGPFQTCGTHGGRLQSRGLLVTGDSDGVGGQREQQRRIPHRLSVLRHAGEIIGNVAATCRYYGSPGRPSTNGSVSSRSAARTGAARRSCSCWCSRRLGWPGPLIAHDHPAATGGFGSPGVKFGGSP